jgi:hypothetical protein
MAKSCLPILFCQGPPSSDVAVGTTTVQDPVHVVDLSESDIEDVEVPAAVTNERIQREHEFLNFARSYDWIGLAALLEQDNTLINAQPGGRWTALHQAARAGEKSVVEWLLYARADLTKRNNEGMTPVDLTKRADIVQLLMAATDGSFHPKEAPEAPTAVGGYLPHGEGGNEDDYYWPPVYEYQMTFQSRRVTPKAFYESLLHFARWYRHFMRLNSLLSSAHICFRCRGCTGNGGAGQDDGQVGCRWGWFLQFLWDLNRFSHIHACHAFGRSNAHCACFSKFRCTDIAAPNHSATGAQPWLRQKMTVICKLA